MTYHIGVLQSVFPSEVSFCNAIYGFSVLKEALEKAIMTKSENENIETRN